MIAAPGERPDAPGCLPPVPTRYLSSEELCLDPRTGLVPFGGGTFWSISQWYLHSGAPKRGESSPRIRLPSLEEITPNQRVLSKGPETSQNTFSAIRETPNQRVLSKGSETSQIRSLPFEKIKEILIFFQIWILFFFKSEKKSFFFKSEKK